uniref:Uncharacterized protein n=1 Tax=Anopheles minimus TaxID=112268 RepID=A0A182WFJ3_9DIPT
MATTTNGLRETKFGGSVVRFNSKPEVLATTANSDMAPPDGPMQYDSKWSPMLPAAPISPTCSVFQPTKIETDTLEANSPARDPSIPKGSSFSPPSKPGTRSIGRNVSLTYYRH